MAGCGTAPVASGSGARFPPRLVVSPAFLVHGLHEAQPCAAEFDGLWSAPTGSHRPCASLVEYLGTGERFIRRLVSQWRISYIKLGKYARLQRSAPDAFIEAGPVPND